MLLSDTLSRHHLESSSCNAKEAGESQEDTIETDEREQINHQVPKRDRERSRITNSQIVYPIRMARKPKGFKPDD